MQCLITPAITSLEPRFCQLMKNKKPLIQPVSFFFLSSFFLQAIRYLEINSSPVSSAPARRPGNLEPNTY